MIRKLTSDIAILILIILGLAIPFVYIFKLWSDDLIVWGEAANIESVGDVGTFIAATTGSLWGLASILLIYRSILLSQKQQVENSYLNLLATLSQLVNNTHGKINQNDKAENYIGIDFYSKILQEFKTPIERGSTCGKFGAQSQFALQNAFSMFADIHNNIYKIEYVICVYEKVYKEHQKQLGHFYRFIYNTIKIIDDNKILDDEEKEKYINLIQAQLSNDILGLLFYNSLSSMGKDKNGQDKFRQYLDNYGLLENIDPESIIQVEDLKNYPKTKFKIGL